MPSVRCLLLALTAMYLIFVAEGAGLRINCALVLCAEPNCPHPFPADPLRGRCCRICPPPTEPPTLDCSLVSCFVPCSNPDPPPQGKCCPICPEPPTLDCRLVFCGQPKCKKPLPPPKGECCPVCPDPPTTEPPTQDCRLVRCAKPDCSNPLPPPRGQCCEVCPTGCRVDDNFYEVGDRFSTKDGCNRCYCAGLDRVICTKRACPKIRCKLNGRFFEVGDTFPAGDGCNKCQCSKGGRISCTEKACVRCPVKGQVFTNCASACPPTCTDPDPECTKLCVARCECPEGKLIDEISNTCVTRDECPWPCPPGVTAVNCFVDPCLFGKCPAHPQATCTADYCGGCNARFFNAKGNEVTNSCDCPVQGQLFSYCSSACTPNCTTPDPICTRQCVARCQCPKGTVINEKTNVCIPVNQCPKKCPPTQVFNDCGSACTPTCSTPFIPCTLQCVPRCECPRDKLFNEATGKCVLRSQCPGYHKTTAEDASK